LRRRRAQHGFSLLELMTAAAIFIILCGAAFGLLMVTQKNYQSESQVLNSFQEARLGVDQIVRDVNISGFPPPGQFSNIAANSNFNYFAISPVAWWPGYAATPPNPCTIGGNCVTPGDFDLIIESDVDLEQERASGAAEDVEWVRYQLQGTTLFRGVLTPKVPGGNPDALTAATLAPFVQNVMNNASAAQIAQFQAVYPGMFAGGQPVPIFRYLCDDTGNGVLVRCDLLGTHSPVNVREVEVTLIVQAPQLDATTGSPRLVTLNGRGHRVNPNAGP
jgi:prepilin-type N-terminal cleavage/methylation domain-containing protein